MQKRELFLHIVPVIEVFTIFQDVTLFDNTILENIRVGRKDATDIEVIAAAKLANVDEFAERLPNKWQTNIGENGCELSGASDSAFPLPGRSSKMRPSYCRTRQPPRWMWKTKR